MVPLSSEHESCAETILSPEAARFDLAGPAAATNTALGAESVMRSLVGRTVANVERELILETLKHCRGNRTHAASILGISIRTLRNKLNQYARTGVPVTLPYGKSDG